MKTKLMRFITSFFESWREEKKVLANQPESIVEHTDITVVRSTNHPVAERVKTAPVSLTIMSTARNLPTMLIPPPSTLDSITLI